MPDHKAVFQWLFRIGALISLLGILRPGAAHSADKVAILVVSDDTFFNRGVPEGLQKLATRTYQQLGYKVIVVGGTDENASAFNRQELRAAFKEAQGAKDVRLDFIGHGNLLSVTDPSITPIVLSPERTTLSEKVPKAGEGRRLIWQASDVSLDEAYPRLSEILGGSDAPGGLNHFEVGQSIAEFHKESPQSLITANLLNCYSGALAQHLRKMPNTLVFANAPATETALGTLSSATQEGITAMSEYYSLLTVPNSSATFHEARRLANQRFMFGGVKPSSNGSLTAYHTGRSPLIESVIGWCENKTLPRSASELPRTELMNQIFSDMGEEQREIESHYRAALQKQGPRSPSLGAMEERLQCDPPKDLPYEQRAKVCYDRCLKHKQRHEPEIDNRGRMSSSSQRARNVVGAYLQGLLTQLEKPAPDSLQPRLKKTLDEVAKEADRLKLSPTRRGMLGRLTQSKELNLEGTIKAMRAYVQRAVQACSQGDINLPPCSDFERGTKEVESLLLGTELGHNPGRCGYGLAPDCLAQLGTSAKAQDLYGFWSEREGWQKPQCGEMDWPKIRRTLANLELDRKCLAEFKRSAPKEEWENLVRLWNLGNRPANGKRSPPTASPDCDSAQESARPIQMETETSIQQIGDKIPAER